VTEPASIRTLGIRAEDELERFFALSNDLLCVARSDGYFVRVNPAFERVLGYTAAELTSRSFLELVHPDDVDATLAELDGLARGARSVAFENRYRRRDGAYRWLQWNGIPDYDHRVVYAVARDVTDARLGEAELRTLAAGQSALRRVATLVARDGDHSAVFRLVTEEVGRLLEAESSSIVRFEPSGRGVVIGGWSLPEAPRLPPGSALELDDGSVAGRVYRSGEAARIEGFGGAEGTLERRLGDLGFRSAVGAPILVAGEVWGALVASSAARERWPEDAEKRLSDFAELVAQALANADARDQLAASRARLVEASDAERRRLERNLHDGAQQRLVTLALLLRRARLGAADEGGAALLDGATEELDRALAELRELANGLHPAVLADHGLRPALVAVAQRAAIPVELVGVPKERLPHSAEVAAYYLVSEALTNVAKYAEASFATVVVSRDDESVTVEVSDDGVGGADASAGSGLRGLSDRISALGGSLVVDSPPGTGTTVRAEIPL
jgi:PAS domain S-box-containing protein